MSGSSDERPIDGSLSVSDRLQSIDTKIDILLAQSLPLRVRALEIVVYGGCGIGLLGMAGAIVKLVIA